VTGPLVLVSAVGGASGSKAAAAALACAGSELDRAGLLVDVGGRPPRPTLVASAGARGLEERLAAHLPALRGAARGQTCHLAVPADESALAAVASAIPLARDSVAVVHLLPTFFRDVLGAPEVRPTGVLLRADLPADRAPAALAVAELVARDLRVAVLKQPLAWIPARRALFGALPADGQGGLSKRLVRRLFSPVRHECYIGIR
jgi:hypothetical protein